MIMRPDIIVVQFLTVKILLMKVQLSSAMLMMLLVLFIGSVAMLLSYSLSLTRKLKLKEKVISEHLQDLQYITLSTSELINNREKQLGQFYVLLSDTITRMDRLKRTIERKMAFKNYDDITSSLNQINIKAEREKLYASFDKMFLTIFPGFVTEFNALMKTEDQIWPAKVDSLPKELRIFALMRLGIHDNEELSSMLEYSTNTIYVYKMRVRAKSIYKAEDFDKKLMSIRGAEIENITMLKKSNIPSES